MDLQLTGKRALVTGSSIGIGEGIAQALAAEGVAVAVHGRDHERTQRVTASIIERGGNAVTVLGDLTREDEAQHVADHVVRQLGGVDILVNNAGGSGDKYVWDQAPAGVWADAFNRNVLAAVRLTNRLLEPMRRAGWGRIVNISSAAGVMPPATGPDYSACKAALNNMTVSLAKAVAQSGITVNSISPGTILTPKLETAFRQLADVNGWTSGNAEWSEVERAVLPSVVQVPIGRTGRIGDIAYAAVFLCSPLAGYITGEDLRIDGGLVPTL